MQKEGIVAFAFGSVVANNFIAAIAVGGSYSSSGQRPVFTQWDLSFAPYLERGLPPLDITYLGKELAPPTLRISRGAAKWAQERGLTKLLVVAAGPHLRRARRDLKLALKELDLAIEVDFMKTCIVIPPDKWFRGDSTQWHTRHRFAWGFRERILRKMSVPLYCRIAS